MWEQSTNCPECNDPRAIYKPTGDLYLGVVIPTIKLTPTLPRRALFKKYPDYIFTEVLVTFSDDLAAFFKKDSEPTIIPLRRCKQCSTKYLNN